MGPESGDQPFLPLLEKANKFPALSDKNWLCDFAFAVDIFSYLNELNVKLRGETISWCTTCKNMHKSSNLS